MVSCTDSSSGEMFALRMMTNKYREDVGRRKIGEDVRGRSEGEEETDKHNSSTGDYFSCKDKLLGQ